MLTENLSLLIVGAVLATAVVARADGGDEPASTKLNEAEREFTALHDAYIVQYKPRYLESRQAWWESNTTGTDEAFARRRDADNALVELHSDPATFAKLRVLREGGQVRNPMLRRELDVMYRTFLAHQADPQLQKRIVELEGQVEQIFNTHRGRVGGKPATENDIRAVLGETKDSARAEEAWKAYMEVGAKVDAKLRELVALRNEVARSLGFPNFYSMSLELQEVDEKELFRLFDELDALTREPFAALKQQIDMERAARFGIAPSELRPWHFGDLFFQEYPGGKGVNLDELYAGKDVLAMAQKYYASLGMPVDDILARSDLYEKPGKSPHAFSTDIDRAGDIRILCNVRPNLEWMDTLLHELGHAVYDKYIDPELPFELREASHAITTEGVAMMFGSMAKNQDYLARVVGLDPESAAQAGESARRYLRAEKLIFSRWAQVMVRFEHDMYNDPSQDLGQLWWDLKKRYQLLNPPDDPSRPDYGAKIHIVTTPVYYHGYMFGDLFAAQVQAAVARDVLGGVDPARTSFFGQAGAGAYLRDRIFAPGDLYSWNELTRRATGEPLTPKYFVQLYVQ